MAVGMKTVVASEVGAGAGAWAETETAETAIAITIIMAKRFIIFIDSMKELCNSNLR